MALNKTIEALPAELIQGIFSHVSELPSIQQSRLVSRRFNEAASPYLIENVHVCMTSKSLSHFEELCDHYVFSKTIRKVTVILSYYDVTLASNRPLFVENCHTQLSQHLETLQRMGSFRVFRKYRRAMEGDHADDENYDMEDDQIEKRLWELIGHHELSEISEETFEESSATPFQKLVMRLHGMYKQQCDDQEDVRRDNKHISRMCAAISKLLNLEEINFEDNASARQEDLNPSDFKDLGFKRSVLDTFAFALSPSRWCGTFITAYSTAQPLEMFGEICSQLGQNGIRPQSISMELSAPANLCPLRLSSNQQLGLRAFVSKATKLKLVVSSWARKSSLAENNDRPRDEMLALCSFTQPFFSAPDLESLYIFFVEYPSFHETPNVSLADILPMEKPRPRLSNIELRYQPSTLDDLKILVSLQGGTVSNFKWEGGWLLSGGWNEAIEVLRCFEKIEDVSIKYPRGERYGSGMGMGIHMPCRQVQRYILKETSINPLS